MDQGPGAVVLSVYLCAHIEYPGARPSVHLLLIWRLKAYLRPKAGKNRFGVSGKARRLEPLCNAFAFRGGIRTVLLRFMACTRGACCCVGTYFAACGSFF